LTSSRLNNQRAKSKAEDAKRWEWRTWHWSVLIAGFAIRVTYCLTVDKESSFAGWDGKEYYAYGQSLLALRWDHYPRYFNDIRPPFYPIFLAPFLALNNHAVWHIQIFQCGLGVLQAIILAKIAGRWIGQRAGNIAFVTALFHPFLIYYCGFVLTETLFILLLWFGILCLQRFDAPAERSRDRWLICAALSLALACLTRPTLQLFLPVAALWIGWRVLSTSGWFTAVKITAVFTIIVSALLLPWMLGNLWAHGELTLAPGSAPVNYAFSNSQAYLRMYEATSKEEYYQHFGQMVETLSVASGKPPASLITEARDFRQNHPDDWWRLQWYKFKHFWTPWLNPLIFSRANVLISVVAITPLFLLGAAEVIPRVRKPDALFVLLLGLIAVGYLVAGFLFHVQVRYRFPYVDVTLMLMTASFVSRLSLSRAREWKLMHIIRPETSSATP